MACPKVRRMGDGSFVAARDVDTPEASNAAAKTASVFRLMFQIVFI